MENEVVDQKLPKSICNKGSDDKASAGLQRPQILIVSTLDGRLTALDPQKNGEMLWSVATGDLTDFLKIFLLCKCLE